MKCNTIPDLSRYVEKEWCNSEVDITTIKNRTYLTISQKLRTKIEKAWIQLWNKPKVFRIYEVQYGIDIISINKYMQSKILEILETNVK